MENSEFLVGVSKGFSASDITCVRLTSRGGQNLAFPFNFLDDIVEPEFILSLFSTSNFFGVSSDKRLSGTLTLLCIEPFPSNSRVDEFAVEPSMDDMQQLFSLAVLLTTDDFFDTFDRGDAVGVA